MAGAQQLPVLVCSALIVLSLPYMCQAAVAREHATVNPAHPGKCWLKEDGLALALGESRDYASCFRKTCERSSLLQPEQLYLVYTGCGKIAVPPGCVMVEKKGGPFPDCCLNMACPSTRSPDRLETKAPSTRSPAGLETEVDEDETEVDEDETEVDEDETEVDEEETQVDEDYNSISSEETD